MNKSETEALEVTHRGSTLPKRAPVDRAADAVGSGNSCHHPDRRIRRRCRRCRGGARGRWRCRSGPRRSSGPARGRAGSGSSRDAPACIRRCARDSSSWRRVGGVPLDTFCFLQVSLCWQSASVQFVYVDRACWYVSGDSPASTC